MHSFPRDFALLSLVVGLAACGTAELAPPPPIAGIPGAASSAAPRPEDGRVYKIDANDSAVRIFVFRGGAASRLGHNHVLTVPDLSGFVQLPGQETDKAHFELAFRLDRMVVDSAALRHSLGPAFATEVSPEAAAGTRTNMLGEAGLQAGRFPELRIRSLQLTGEGPRLAAQIQVALHGQSRDLWLPLEVDVSDSALRARGAMVIRQSDFGIKPFSVLGGLLAVRDELVIDFDLSAVPETARH